MPKTFLFYICISILVIGCKKTNTTPKVKSVEVNRLLDLARNDYVSLEDKYNALVESYVSVLADAAQKNDPEMRQLLQQYKASNQSALIAFEEQFDTWQKNMTHEERMYFVINLIGKPSTRQLTQLVPVIKRRLAPYPQELQDFNRLLMRLDVRR